MSINKSIWGGPITKQKYIAKNNAILNSDNTNQSFKFISDNMNLYETAYAIHTTKNVNIVLTKKFVIPGTIPIIQKVKIPTNSKVYIPSTLETIKSLSGTFITQYSIQAQTR